MIEANYQIWKVSFIFISKGKIIRKVIKGLKESINMKKILKIRKK